MSDEILVSKEFLEKLRYQFVCVNGLKGFDDGAENILRQESSIVLPKEDIIDLDYTGLIKEIDKTIEHGLKYES